MSTDFHTLLSGLLDIYQEADWNDQTDSHGAMDLGDRLITIHGIAGALLIEAGWDPNGSDDQDELEYDGK
jgi:hypothetical protein